MSRIKTELKLDRNSTSGIHRLKNPARGFLMFLSKYSIASMAIGVVIGQTTKDTVDSLVTGMITPAFQLLMPHVDFQDLVIKTGKAEFAVGNFLNSLIKMLIIMLILYIVIVKLLKRDDLVEGKSAVATKVPKK